MNKGKKIVFVLIDGIGDVSYEKLGNKTPIEFANIPNINKVCRKGVCGLMDPYEPGKACGSDTAHLSIFAYDPNIFYSGRGCFECMGADLHLNVGDIGFKSNFATINENGIVVKRRADREFEREGPILCEYLTDLKVPGYSDHEVNVQYATEHRCGIRVSGKNLSNKITGTDPLKDNLKLIVCKPTVNKDHPEYDNAVFTSRLINTISQEISKKLVDHPINKERSEQGKNLANVILFRGAGTRLEVPEFEKKHEMKGFMIAPTCMIAGFGLNIGLDLVKVKGATGDIHTNFDAKRDGFLKEIRKDEYDFGFLHIKAVDDCGHEGLIDMKIKMIEKSDKMIGEIIQELEKDNIPFVLAVTGDHTTPCSYGDHSIEPVPFCVSRFGTFKKEIKDDVEVYSENDCGQGYLGRFTGMQVFEIMKNMAKTE